MRTLHRSGPLVLALSVILLSYHPVAVADDKPDDKSPPKWTAEQRALDATIRNSLFDVIDYAFRLHNSGDVAGGYRVYQGGLLATRPLLNHHPDFQAYIREGLVAADRMASSDRPEDIEKASFKLRAVIDNVRDGLKTGELPAGAKPLWARLGGEKEVTKIVDDFITLAVNDPKVNFTRNGKYTVDKDKLRTALVAQISSLTGGPIPYKGDMKAIHKDMNISNAEFDAALDDLRRAVFASRVVGKEDANALLDMVAETRRDIVTQKAPPKPPTSTTAWDALGGEEGVKKIIDEFVDLSSKDPAVNFTRNGKYKLDEDTLKKVKAELVKQVSYLTNGPYKAEKDAPPPWKGLGITEVEYEAATLYWAKALKDNKVPADVANKLSLSVTALKDKIVEGKPDDLPKPKPTVWANLDGFKGVEKIVDDYYTAAAKNPKANLDQGGKLKLEGAAVENIKKQMTAQVAATSGGPKIGETTPFDKNAKLTDEEFTARKDALKEALAKHGVKADDTKTILDAFEAYRKEVVETKKPDDKPKGGEVSGMVTVGDKPLPKGTIGFIYFNPDKKDEKKEPITGEIKDGKYTVKGVTPGWYRVTVDGGDDVNATYHSAITTSLKIEVTKEKETADFKVTK